MSKTPIEVLDDPVSQRVVAGLSRIGMALRSKAWKEASSRGLTPTQGQILAFLFAHEGSRLTDVAAALAISAPTASDAVATLDRKGYLRKQISRTDPRAIALRLTASGKREVQRSSNWPEFLLRAVESLSRAEQESLLVLVSKLLRTMQQSGDIPPLRSCITCAHFQPYVSSGPDAAHHCASFKVPLGNQHLRVDCPQYGKATEDQLRAIWQAFNNSVPPDRK